MYRPATPFRSPMRLLIPTYTRAKGVPIQSYPEPEAENTPTIYGTFRSFGGTETSENGVVTVTATGYVDTWYRPDIKSDCRLYIVETGETYECLGDPEDIEMKHVYHKIRVRKIGGRP